MQAPKRSFTMRRLRNVFCISLIIAAGAAALALIGSSHAIARAGSASGEDEVSEFVGNSAGGATPTPTPLCGGGCSQPVVLNENFDSVTPPMLPAGWLATNALGPPPLWVTSNIGVPAPPADTAPNAAFIDDPAVVSDKRLDSLQLPADSVQLTFHQNFNLEASEMDPNVGFDGGVLEMSTDGGNTFQDILAVAAASSQVVIPVLSAPIGAVRLEAVRPGVAIRRALSLRLSTCRAVSDPQDSAGVWLAITVAPVKAGALTR